MKYKISIIALVVCNLSIIGSAVAVSLPSVSAIPVAEDKIGIWAESHPRAASELGEWVNTYRDAARELFKWALRTRKNRRLLSLG